MAAAISRVTVGGDLMLASDELPVIDGQPGLRKALCPGQIEPGAGRAHGTDPLTAQILRRMLNSAADCFIQDPVELPGCL